MAHQHKTDRTGHESSNGRTKWIIAGFLGVAGFFLITEHQAHLYGALPYLLILACPLMHLLHGHGRHHDSSGTAHEHKHTGDGHPGQPPHSSSREQS